jgi:hypothetical protein
MRVTAPIAALLVAVTAMSFAACATLHRSEARSTEEMLAAAGFRVKPANTLARLANLDSMPPRQLIAQVREGRSVYSYADPDNCHCLYVGGPKEYAAYQRRASERLLADDRYMEVMDWDLWEPWAW